MTPVVITLAGPDGVGKSTTALEIVRAGNKTRATFTSLAIAEPIYKAVSVITNVPVIYLHEYNHRTFLEIAKDRSLPVPATFFPRTVRDVLRAFGSDAVRRTFGDDVWLDHVKARISSCRVDVVVIEDARTPVEWAFGKMILLSRHGVTYSKAHETDCPPPSEMVWASYDLSASPRKTGEDLAEKILSELVGK